MKQSLIKGGRRMLLVLLAASLLTMWAGAGLVTAVGPPDADPQRAFSKDVVAPGEEFEVTVTFTAPADNFNAIGLNDAAPEGWLTTVDAAWATPLPSMALTPEDNEAEYMWFLEYDEDEEFTAMYKVQVPVDAEEGPYSFSGVIEFYIGPDGPFFNVVGGDAEVTVDGEETPAVNPGDGGAQRTGRLGILALWIAIGAAIVATLLLLRRRRARS